MERQVAAWFSSTTEPAGVAPPRTEREQQEQEVLVGYTAAIRSVLQTKGQAPFKLPGLAIYETLQQIDASVSRCLQAHPHALLVAIQELTRRRHPWDEEYAHIRRQQDWVLGLAELLNVSRTAQGGYTQAGVEVAQEVEQFLDGLESWQSYFPEDAAFIGHLIRRTAAWAPGLFNCYEAPAIPRTDNALEQYIGFLKQQRRRTTGHKAVADYITRHGPYAVFYAAEETVAATLIRFQQVSTLEFRAERQRFRAAQAGQRRVRSFRRDPESYLQRLELLWPREAPS